MNYEEIQIITIAKMVGLPIQAKIHRIIQAPKFHTGSYRVPIGYGFNRREVNVKLELYRDERGDGLWLGYDEQYSILVWKPE